MGRWKCDVYSDDTVMDILADMYCNLKKMSVEKALDRVKKSELYKYEEGKLIIAELEKLYFGNIPNEKEIKAIIEHEKSEEVINEWDSPQERLKELIKFEDKIFNKDIPKMDKEELYDYIKELRKKDIMCVFGKL